MCSKHGGIISYFLVPKQNIFADSDIHNEATNRAVIVCVSRYVSHFEFSQNQLSILEWTHWFHIAVTKRHHVWLEYWESQGLFVLLSVTQVSLSSMEYLSSGRKYWDFVLDLNSEGNPCYKGNAWWSKFLRCCVERSFCLLLRIYLCLENGQDILIFWLFVSDIVLSQLSPKVY